VCDFADIVRGYIGCIAGKVGVVAGIVAAKPLEVQDASRHSEFSLACHAEDNVHELLEIGDIADEHAKIVAGNLGWGRVDNTLLGNIAGALQSHVDICGMGNNVF
jgi:hypothetical protein